ncbi:MAG: signal peptide peptidase SppA [candidate division KSB1 bacterium]|nr:signal peptide peptidase SppA [candidate division KSB1 bacterium]MDZ7301464.1 signal peptide peptidase SppA [candidate division KSB1 bacterium]MDZ7310866.1 signal peptide peptidase SppA [candidate division KSB1 bacterium]
MKYTLCAAALVLLFHNIAQSQVNSNSDLFSSRARSFSFVATADAPADLLINPALLAIPHGQNFSYSTFLNESNAALEHHMQITGTPFLPLLSWRRASLGTKSTATNFYSIGAAIGGKSGGIGLVTEWFSGDLTGKRTRHTYHFGTFWRPTNGLSFGYVWNHFNSPAFNGREIDARHTLGIGVRPWGNERLTLAAEIAMRDKTNLDTTPFKIGGDFKLAKGWHLRGSWRDQRDGTREITFGLGFDLPNSGVGIDNARTKDKNAGTRITLSATQFRKPSLIHGTKKIAEIKLEGVYPDYDVPPPMLGNLAFGKSRRGLQSIIRELDRIAESPEIGGLLLQIKNFATSYPIFGLSGNLQELGAAIKRVRAAGKPVVAYLDADDAGGAFAGVAEYYIASHANQIMIAELAGLGQYGIHFQSIKYRYTAKKLGIDVRTYTAGKYKSSLNPISDSLSTVKIEELDQLVDETYEQMLQQVAEGRGLQMTQTLRDTLSSLLFPATAKALRLVDRIGWYEDAQKLAAQIVFGDSNRTRLVNMANLKDWDTNWQRQKGVAVIGVYGSIVTGESKPPSGLPIPFLAQGRSTGSATVLKQLEAAVKDRYTKAIVLRVDSPGGSAIASDEITRKIREVRKKKPLVVSMGDLAASGGYYVSTYGEKIFATPLTMTGSIGVITAIPFLYDLAKHADLYVRNFDRGKYSPLLDVFQPPSPELESWITRALNFYYEPFLQKVADGRNLDMAHVREVAQGRIWTGARAKEIKLIDEFGGLYDALEYARKKVGLPRNYQVQFYAVPPTSVMPGVGAVLSKESNW